MNPLYRIKMSVYDDQTGEEVAFIDEPMMSQDSRDKDHRDHDNLHVYHRALRAFETSRPDFEATHYPKDDAQSE